MIKLKNLISRVLSPGEKSWKGIPGMGGRFSSHAGVSVSPLDGWRQIDVYTCVKIISDHIGMLPLKVYTQDNAGVLSPVSQGTRAHKILCERPNDYMSTQDLVEYLVRVLLLRGHAFLDVKTSGIGSVQSLTPLRFANAVTTDMDAHGVPFATWTTNDSKSRVSYAPFIDDGLFDVKINTINGYGGISPIQLTAEHLGIAIAEGRHTSKTFENGTRLSGVLSTDGILKDDSYERVKEDWNNTYGGTENSGKVAILEDGLKYQAITMSNHDAQLLELMKLSREQIAAMYGVPSRMLNDGESGTYGSLEQDDKNFFKTALQPIIKKLEEAFSDVLGGRYCVKFDCTKYTKADLQTQANAVDLLIKNKVLSAEEARQWFDMAPADPDQMFALDTNNLTWLSLKNAGRLEELTLQKLENEAKPQPAPVAPQAAQPPAEPEEEKRRVPIRGRLRQSPPTSGSVVVR